MISAPSGKIITRFGTARGVNPPRLIARYSSARASGSEICRRRGNVQSVRLANRFQRPTRWCRRRLRSVKCVSKIEWDSIVGSHLVGLTDSTARTMSTVEPCSHRIPIEKAHELVSRVVYWVTEPAASNPKSYVFVDSFDVWPDLDNRLLYQCLRARHGNHDSLESQPGHICLWARTRGSGGVVALRR